MGLLLGTHQISCAPEHLSLYHEWIYLLCIAVIEWCVLFKTFHSFRAKTFCCSDCLCKLKFVQSVDAFLIFFNLAIDIFQHIVAKFELN